MNKISTGVSKLKEWDDSVWYKVNCACGDSDCDAIITFDFDKDCGINITFYKTIRWCDYNHNIWFFQRFWLRIKMAIQILFKGYIEFEGSFIIQNENHLNDFITALQEGKEKMLIKKENKNVD